MPSPFPGMDPFLEESQLWPGFHHQFLSCLHQILVPSLVDRYRARLNQRHYVAEQALFTSVISEEHLEEYLEIRQRKDGRLITLVDVVSPTNKTIPAGRSSYLCTRQEAMEMHASVVEIDLIVQGNPTLDYSREDLPEWDYAVTVTRGTHPERYEIYTSTLQKRLPRFRLPLAADDRDTVVDLQAAFSRCYDQGCFADEIDYQHDPCIGLEDEDRRWLHDLLTQHKLR